MNDRNDTIEYLKYLRDRAVISGSTITEPSDWITRLCDEVLELLKEQEPRVLTLEELKTIGDKDAVYLETIVMNLGEPNVKPAIYQPDNSDDEYVCVVSSWLKSGFYSPHNYLKSWRCWSARPTDEQREAVPWTE